MKYNNLEYYNYNNNNYNQPLYSKDENPSTLYDPYQGFIRGNMFPNLYNAYKTETPENLPNDLLTYLNALTFAAHDINLYLDVYPDDKDMIKLFNQYREESIKLLMEYQEKNGPIVITSDENNVYPFRWIDGWPWLGDDKNV